MEVGGQNGVRTDHEKDRLNGTIGSDGPPSGTEKAKVASAATGVDSVVNGGKTGNGAESTAHSNDNQNTVKQESQQAADRSSRMNDLPDEIVHITQGFVPLSLFLTRLAQTTHNSLQDKISELAKMPIPATAANGHSVTSGTASDDYSNENLRKKANLLNFAQDMHAKWVKALVITEWSRKSEMVSKLIDLKYHVDQQRILYDAALDNIVNVKRDLTFARMPSPDLKTALQILSTGSAPWLPDLQYIEPPALTAEEQVKWMHDLNTLLSLRLNLDDYDKIPHQFRDYEISSGRVTFKVPGEFEVDLTIADEDFEKQFWFIDFRVTFSPAPSTLPDSLRAYLEACVNEALSKDGLTGCYEFLHEFVLTMKINELKRQALQLSRSSWTGTLTVEPLNRALAIQYWTSRSLNQSLKSWVLIAVNKGRKQGVSEQKSSSFLVAKWYRENKEVKDIEIPLNVEELSTESLLRTVIGRHIEHVLRSIYDRLLMAPRFKNREAALTLQISGTDPSASTLKTQVGYRDNASLLIEPTTGQFAIKPHSKFTIQYEHHLNNGRNPTDDGVTSLENVRCGLVEDELNRRGSCMGWLTRKALLSNEELRSITRLRDWTRAIWLQKDGWGPDWFIVVFLGLGGDEWWLFEAHNKENERGVRFQAKLPLNKGHPDLSDTFWNNLTLFATGMMAQSVDMRELHRLKIKCRPNESMNWSLPQQVRLPSIEIALSAVFPAMVVDVAEKEAIGGSFIAASGNAELASITRPATGNRLSLSPRQPWANNMVTIKFKGVQSQSTWSEGQNENATQRLVCVSDAVIKVKRPAKFAALPSMVDWDVSYNPKKGEFCLRMRHPIEKSMVGALQSRIKAVDRFVTFLESMDKAKGTITSESVTLREVTFSYSEANVDSVPDEASQATQRWRVVLDLSKDDINIELEAGNPHLRVVDLMKRLVNTDGGIGALMVWLPASTRALKAIDDIESDWQDIQEKNQGQVEFSMKTIDWMTIRYTIGGTDATDGQKPKQLSLDVSMKVRRGEPWWHLTRTVIANGEVPPEDDFTQALKPIFEGKGEGWLGLTTSAAGKPDNGVVGMLQAVDNAMRTMAAGEAATAKPELQGNGSGAAPLVILE
ncbi:Mediator of RNA polymerase II transcription subunit 14 [Paramyrothecium foliicola]|nr:Mediator of RNA polymerase II transcription subunit 14 [Paramyrothecium foliicola]